MASTTARVRLFHDPSLPYAAPAGATTLRIPTQLEVNAVADALTASNGITVADTKPRVAYAKSKVEAACAANIVDISALVNCLISDMVEALREASWLSVPHFASRVYVAPVGVQAVMPGYSATDTVTVGCHYDVFEVFDVMPCALYRTVQQKDMNIVVCTKNGGNGFSQVTPVDCAKFTKTENHFDIATQPLTDFTGLSLERTHPGNNIHATKFIDAVTRSDGSPRDVSYDLNAISVDPYAPVFFGTALASIINGYHELSNKWDKNYSQAFFCYELPKGTDLSALGFCAIYDNTSRSRLGHFTLVRIGLLPEEEWKGVASGGFLVLQPPQAHASLKCVVSQAGGYCYFPSLAAHFFLHCFAIRGRAGYTHFDPDEPGADMDVADALEICAGLVSEDDAAMCRLLEESLAARYVLARMDHDLQSDLADAFLCAQSELLTAEASKAVAEGSKRLREWMGANEASVLLYASTPLGSGGNVARSVVAVSSDDHVDEKRFRLLLQAGLSLSAPGLNKLLSLVSEASNVGEAVHLLENAAHVIADSTSAPRCRSPRLWCAAECALPLLRRTASSELVLRGVPEKFLAGAMADLKDPLTQQLLLACAMLTRHEPVTDVPAFAYAAVNAQPSSALPCEDTTTPLHVTVPPDANDQGRAWFACFFRAAARPLENALDATSAAEGILRDVAVSMWGLESGNFGNFFMITGDRVIGNHAPMYGKLLEMCTEAAAGPGGGDVLVDVAAKEIRARPGEVLFVLLTPRRRIFVDAPAIVVRVLRAHKFPDSTIASKWELGAPLEGDLFDSSNVSMGDPQHTDMSVWYYNFFRAAAQPLDIALDATSAAARILRDNSVSMWGLKSGKFGKFFMVMDGRAIYAEVPMHTQLLIACAAAAAEPGGGFSTVDIAASAIRARPDEVLFVLLTPIQRIFAEAPAIVERVLRTYGFPGAHVACSLTFRDVTLPAASIVPLPACAP